MIASGCRSLEDHFEAVCSVRGKLEVEGEGRHQDDPSGGSRSGVSRRWWFRLRWQWISAVSGW